jgi:hypothetical protein
MLKKRKIEANMYLKWKTHGMRLRPPSLIKTLMEVEPTFILVLKWY